MFFTLPPLVRNDHHSILKSNKCPDRNEYITTKEKKNLNARYSNNNQLFAYITQRRGEWIK